jgi:hypothetical protein
MMHEEQTADTLSTADEPAEGGEAGRDDCSARPQTPADAVYMIVARPRKTSKLPEFPNPACRPEGTLPPLIMNFASEVSNGTDLALGRVPRRNAAAYVGAIQAAGSRSIQVNIDCAGGDGEGALAIAIALLQHKYAVSCRIVGRCSSAAVFIALAADRRSIMPAGSVLLHGSRRLCAPDQWQAVRQLPKNERAAINDSLCDLDDASSALLQARMGVSDHQARCWLREDRTWNSTETLEKLFVHAIDDRGAPAERLKDGYSILGLDGPPGETLPGANYAVEFTAESILKCDVDIEPGVSTPPGATAQWAVSRSRILVPGYAGAWDSVVSGRVDILYDQSGNGRNLSAIASIARPIATTSGPNSRACCDFSPASIASGHTMDTDAVDPVSELVSASAGYMVVSIRADVVTQDSSTASANANVLVFGGFQGGLTLRTTGILYAYNNDGNQDKAPSAAGAVPIGGNPCVIEWRHEGGLIYQRVNGANETSVASGNTSDLTSVLRLGSNATTGSFFDGKFFEGMIYATVPTLEERDAIAADMMTWVGA